jgi:hypothetical protein
MVILLFLSGNLVVHAFQYKFLDGELINSGGLNEFVSFLFLLIISIMHYQKEVTQDDIQVKMEKFEEALSRRSMRSMKTANSINAVPEEQSEGKDDLVIQKYGSS